MDEFKLVDSGWGEVLDQALQYDSSSLSIVCPFIKEGVAKRLLSQGVNDIKVITRFNLSDFYNGVSDISALRILLRNGAQIRGVRNLHSKVYLFGSSRVIVTSANLTESALSKNQEFGFVADDHKIISRCADYFDNMWGRAGQDLTMERLSGWDKRVTSRLAKGSKSNRVVGLNDEGVDLDGDAPGLEISPRVADANQAFVKFFGVSSGREEHTLPVMAEIERAGCHWACSYPVNKRPKQVKDGDIMFMGRLVQNPNDIIIFGRAVALAYVEGRDDATEADIDRRPFKATWPRYARVHHPEFVAGTLENGVSLNELMDTLEENAFGPTQENASTGDPKKNINPRKAYMQQAAVRLSVEGMDWLNAKLEAAFIEHGRIPQAELDALDWPDVSA